MANPTTEGNSLVDPKLSRKLLQAVPLRPIAEDTETGQIASQNGSSRPQREIASFARDESTDKDQVKLGAGLRTARVVDALGTTDARFRNEKQFVAIRSKLGVGLGGRRYNRCRVAIGGPGKRQEPVQIPQAGDPLLL